MNSLKEKILDTVKHEKISMIPRWKFLMYSSIALVSLVFLVLVLIFVVSLVLFLLSRYGFLDMSVGGFGEVLRTLTAIPVFLFLAMIVLVLLIEIVAKQYTTAFKRPVFVMLLLITLGATCIGYLISTTSMHEHMRNYMKEHRFDRFSSMYDRPRPRKSFDGLDVIRGEVVSVTASATLVKLFNGEEITIDFAHASTTQGSAMLPVVGDDVVVLGTTTNGIFVVKKIKMLPQRVDGDRPPHPGMK